MKFSLLVPTRKREKLFNNLCKSIENTTRNLQEIEFLAIIDQDDKITKKYTDKIYIKQLIRKRGTNLSLDYYNWAYPFSTGKYIFVLNDDAEIITPNWDDLVVDFTLDNVFYGKTINNNSIHSHYSYFPILGRVGVEILDQVMSPLFPGHGADDQLFNVYNKIDRIVELDIRINHLEKQRMNDECNVLMRNKEVPNIFTQVKEDSNKLKHYIDQYKIFL